MDSVKPTPRSRRTEKIAVLVILAAILVLFAIFWKSVLFPLIRLEMKHDLAGAQRLLADNGAAGALSVVLIEAMQMFVLLYTFGDGYTNVLFPTSPVLLISLSMIEVEYFTWIRKSTPLFLVNFLLVVGFIVLGVVIGY